MESGFAFIVAHIDIRTEGYQPSYLARILSFISPIGINQWWPTHPIFCIQVSGSNTVSQQQSTDLWPFSGKTRA